VFFTAAAIASAQKSLPRGQNGQGGKKSSSQKSEQPFIRPNVKVWKMVDQYTLADSIPVDTLTDGHQINNKIWKNNVMNVTLGNLGSPYLPMLYINRRRTDGYIFLNTLQEYIDQPQDFIYYNTKTPYTNLAYNMGYPKRRSEEFVQVLFTQNVNRRLNIGVHYKFSTSIGRYESQRADHASVRLFGSYDGDYYSSQMSAIYTRSSIKENGGIIDDDYVIQKDTANKKYDKADDIPVMFMNSKNRHATYQIHYAHKLDIGHVERIDRTDSTEHEIPVATAYHQIYLMRNHHEFHISDLANYKKSFNELFPSIQDSVATADSVKYGMMTNIFQLRLNEEFNSLLRFGLRAYIGHDIKSYHWPDEIRKKTDEDNNISYHYNRHEGVYKNSVFIGGQIFKNRGENIRINAGIKQYISGYNVGDMTINGKIESSMRVFNQPTLLWAKGSYELRSPEVFENDYCSNHYQWHNSFSKQNIFNVRGGVKMDSLGLDLTVFGGIEKHKIFFNTQGVPDQTKKPYNYIGAYLYKRFSIIGFSSINRIAVQKVLSKDTEEIDPLPLFAIYTSNFYERLLFDVLTFQIGFDCRYNTRYWAPQYKPAIMQFCPQDQEAQDKHKVGDYPYIDPFVNMQLKRARIYVKYEHLNAKWGSRDYFHTVHYPANPGFFKVGVSWNFYD